TAALLDLPELTGVEEVAGVDHHALRAGVEAHPAQRVVELVAEEHRADAHLLDLVQAGVDVGLRTLGEAEGGAAAEGVGDLHPEDDGHLALLDVFPRLLRSAGDAEPSLAGSPVTLVDEGLEPLGLLHLAANGVHVVA